MRNGKKKGCFKRKIQTLEKIKRSLKQKMECWKQTFYIKI